MPRRGRRHCVAGLIVCIDVRRIGEAARRWRGFLILNHDQNRIESPLGQRLYRDELGALEHFLDIEGQYVRAPDRIRRNDDHMASAKNTWSGEALDLETDIAIKQHEFAHAFAMKFVYSGEPGDRGSGRSCYDFHFPGTFWNGHENGAAVEIEFFSALGKAKDAVGAEAGKGLIEKSELGPRIDAGTHGRSTTDCIVQGGETRRGSGSKEPHVLNDLGNAGLFLLRGNGELRDSNRNKQRIENCGEREAVAR